METTAVGDDGEVFAAGIVRTSYDTSNEELH